MESLLERLYESKQNLGDARTRETYENPLEESLDYEPTERLFAMYFKGGGFKPMKPFKGFRPKRSATPRTFRIGGKPDSCFKPAKNFGIGGGGIARKTSGTPFIERYRPPHNHKPYGFHVNGHVILPYGKKKRKIMSNTHL